MGRESYAGAAWSPLPLFLFGFLALCPEDGAERLLEQVAAPERGAHGLGGVERGGLPLGEALRVLEQGVAEALGPLRRVRRGLLALPRPTAPALGPGVCFVNST